ncbi:hypothetical protein ES703_25698 [subsurface metagenome]
MRWHEKLRLDEEYIYSLLSQLAQEYLEKKVLRVEPSRALVARFREFVDGVARWYSPLLRSKITGEPLKTQLEGVGYKTDPENLPQTVHNLSRMSGYALMNKIIFHKILEQTYPRIPPLRWLDSSSSVNFQEDLNRCIRRAIDVADFEPIFDTGVYDRLPMPDDPELLEYVNAFIDTIDSVEIAKLGGQI